MTWTEVKKRDNSGWAHTYVMYRCSVCGRLSERPFWKCPACKSREERHGTTKHTAELN